MDVRTPVCHACITLVPYQNSRSISVRCVIVLMTDISIRTHSRCRFCESVLVLFVKGTFVHGAS